MKYCSKLLNNGELCGKKHKAKGLCNTHYNENLRDTIRIDYATHMANCIAAQILSNKECREEFARILAMAQLTITDALRIENENT